MKSGIASVILILSLLGCQEAEESGGLPIDPFIGRIEENSEGLDMPPGFADEFKKRYQESVNVRLKKFPYDSTDPKSIAKIQNIRASTFYNQWGEYGVDYFAIYRPSDYKKLVDKMQGLNNTIQEKEIKIHELEQRIKTLEKNTEQDGGGKRDK